MRSFVPLIIVFCGGLALGVVGALYGKGMVNHISQPYAGQQARYVSSLSSNDVRQLLAGEGWGLAKPAEFNGYPGPAHVLELAEKLTLRTEQRAAIESVFAEMRNRAKVLGEQLVEAERALDAAFQSGAIDSVELSARLADAEAVRSRLRKVHLAAHLKIKPMLNYDQIARYDALRGYGDDKHSSHSGH